MTVTDKKGWKDVYFIWNITCCMYDLLWAEVFLAETCNGKSVWDGAVRKVLQAE